MPCNGCNQVEIVCVHGILHMVKNDYQQKGASGASLPVSVNCAAKRLVN